MSEVVWITTNPTLIVWEDLNRLFHESKRMATPDYWNTQPHELLVNITQSSHMFRGITDSTMIHGEDWQFIQAGSFMERAQATARLIDLHFSEFLHEGGETVNCIGPSGVIACCGAAPRSKPTAKSIRPICARSE